MRRLEERDGRGMMICVYVLNPTLPTYTLQGKLSRVLYLPGFPAEVEVCRNEETQGCLGLALQRQLADFVCFHLG